MIDNFQPIPTIPWWSEPIIPLAYSDAITYYEQVKQLTHHLNMLIENVNSSAVQILANQNEIKALQQSLSIVNSTLDKITNGEYMEQYQQGLATWIDNNLQELVSKIVKYVMFGLTDDGYFVAYIPPSWQFMKFDTIMDYKNAMYGHLVMRW